MARFSLKEHPHRRYNPLLREWVLVSPQRQDRPSPNSLAKAAAPVLQAYDPTCHLCPGNERTAGVRNPRYKSTHVFDDDYPALVAPTPDGGVDAYGLIVARSEPGACRVVSYSPRHDLSVATLDAAAVRKVVDAWTEQYHAMGAMPAIRYVQIYENRGPLMGAGTAHPHGAIQATASQPNEPGREQAAQADYKSLRNSCLLCGYLTLEKDSGERLVCENPHFVALIPFWAVWPYETLVLSRRHVTALDELTVEEKDALADILRRLCIRYDNLFRTPFPYSMGFHQRPTDGLPHAEWHLHAHYYPPLLRSATTHKFMVGFELLGTPQRDTTPEAAARQLRQVSETHYLTTPSPRRRTSP